MKSLAAAALVVISAQIVCGQIDGPAIQEKEKRIIARKFKTCPGASSHYSGLIDFPVLSCSFWDYFRGSGVPPRSVRHCQAVIELKDFGAALLQQTDDLALDQANNIQWRGFLFVNYSMWRTRYIADGLWGVWTDWQRKEQRPYAIEQFQYRRDLWFSEPGPDVFKLPPAQEIPDCTDITNDSSHSGVVAARVRRMLPAFTGTAEQFAQSFPASMERTIVARGLDLDNYAKTSKLIVDTVYTCAQILTEIPHNVTELNEKLAGKYRVCQPQTLTIDPAFPKIQLQIDLGIMVTLEQYKPGVHKQFVVSVDLVGGNYSDSIVTATIR